MIYLLLSVLCSTVLVIILKLFPRYKVHTLHGIVVNYITCVIFGCMVAQVGPSQVLQGFSQEWTIVAVILGLLFITIFNFSAIASQKIGVSVTSMAMKLAFIFPILIGIIFYNESSSFIKIVGVILAIVAVVLTSISSSNKEKEMHSKWIILLPLVVFIGSGFCDSLVQFAQKKYFLQGGFEVFSIMLFAFAAILGFLLALYIYFKDREMLQIQSVVGGVVLGIPNYLSIFFLLKALLKSGWESTVVFPLANISVVICSALIGIFFFKEKMNKWNFVGLSLAVVAVVLLIITTNV